MGSNYHAVCSIIRNSTVDIFNGFNEVSFQKFSSINVYIHLKLSTKVITDFFSMSISYWIWYKIFWYNYIYIGMCEHTRAHTQTHMITLRFYLWIQNLDHNTKNGEERTETAEIKFLRSTAGYTGLLNHITSS